MNYNMDGYPAELAEITEGGYDQLNLSVSATAFMMGMSRLIGDQDLERRTEDFWAKEPRIFGHSLHRFECVGQASWVDLSRWCGRQVVADQITVEILTTGREQFASYRFTEDLARVPARQLSITMQNPRDVVYSKWESVVVERDPQNALVVTEQIVLPQEGGVGVDNFIRLVTTVQADLGETSYARVSNER